MDELKKNWPLAAGVALGLLVLFLVLRGRQQAAGYSYQTGPTSGEITAAIQGQVAISQAELQAKTSMFNTLAAAVSATDIAQIQATRDYNISVASANAGVQQVQAYTQAQNMAVQNQFQLGLLRTILPVIFPNLNPAPSAALMAPSI